MSGSVDCLSRIPYASVIAFILILSGAGIMCGTLYEALNITENIFNTNFYPVDELFLARIASIVVASCVVAFGIVLLVFGVLTTGATRARIYRGDKCIMGGRMSAGLFMFLTYMVNIFWLALAVVLVIPVMAWLMLSKVCKEELEYYHGLNKDKDSETFTYKFNITSYGIYKKVFLFPKNLNYRETIPNVSHFSFFCTEISNVGPLFACSLGGAIFVILGLTCFSGSLSACYIKLKLIREVSKCRKIRSLISGYQEEEDVAQFPHPSMEPSTLPLGPHRLPSPSAVPVFPQNMMKDFHEKHF